MTRSDAIKAARLKLGMTQAQFASRVGVSNPIVSQWESGSRRPRPLHLVTIAGLLKGMSPLSSVIFLADSGIDVEALQDVFEAVRAQGLDLHIIRLGGAQ